MLYFYSLNIKLIKLDYVRNKYPKWAEAEEIATQWNAADFYFTSIVMVSIQHDSGILTRLLNFCGT